jgi:hypothetical protein
VFEEIDPVCGDHELPAEQEARPDAEDKADEAMGHCSVPLIERTSLRTM